MFEFAYAYLVGMQNGVAVLAILTFIGALMSGAAVLLLNENHEAEPRAQAKRALKITLPIALLSGAIAAIPTPDDLFRVRLGLLKYELASKENVQTGAAAIERIAHKLEVKYLDQPMRDAATPKAKQ